MPLSHATIVEPGMAVIWRKSLTDPAAPHAPMRKAAGQTKQVASQAARSTQTQIGHLKRGSPAACAPPPCPLTAQAL
jgi:hypothetical protein